MKIRPQEKIDNFAFKNSNIIIEGLIWKRKDYFSWKKFEPVRKLPYFALFKKRLGPGPGRLSDQKIYVTALITFVYGQNKLPLLLSKAAWSISYLRYPCGSDKIRIGSTLLVIRIYCLLLPFVLIFASVWIYHNLFKPA